jgi:hypothetical protein
MSEFDYYYGAEAEQFSFLRVPKLLIKDERFKGLSSDAKLLYGLMLDRMALSVKNGWFDDKNRAYIIYTLENIMEDLGCARQKCSKVLSELENGLGLIEKKRQGLCKPDIIYVKNFATLDVNENSENNEKSASNDDVDTEVRKSNVQKYENQTSGSMEIKRQEVRKSYSNNTNINNTYRSDTNLINHIQEVECNGNKQMDKIDNTDTYLQIIKDNIEYDHYMQQANDTEKQQYEELFQIITDVVCISRKTVRIAGEQYPYAIVKARFLKLKSSHLQYVIDCMKKTTTKISNIKSYLITALYNALSTMSHYYQQAVQHDIGIGDKNNDKPVNNSSKNKFNNFQQRDIDIDSLERKLLEMNMGQYNNLIY